MLHKIKQKAKEKGRRYADKIFRSSPSERASVSTNDSRTANTPLPTAPLPEPAADPIPLATSSSSPQVAPSSAPQPAVASPIPPSTDTLPPLSQTNELHLPTVPDPAPIQRSSAASTASSVAEQSGKKAAWSGLKTLVELLNVSADAFGPLKSAVSWISMFIEINDVRIRICVIY
ncbi:hypothetical protein BDV93DRAFT_170518 [Ceratobasidium sp. AG-I]|nr:hypothetical protein BDV93DRAFT_170518 [Ceratobasidium sp. AG-I]